MVRQPLLSLASFLALMLPSTAFGATGMDDNDAVAVFVLVAGLIYIIPSLVGFVRRHPNRWVILLLNIFLGATGIVWFGTLIWACMAVHVTKDPDGSNGGESA